MLSVSALQFERVCLVLPICCNTSVCRKQIKSIARSIRRNNHKTLLNTGKCHVILYFIKEPRSRFLDVIMVITSIWILQNRHPLPTTRNLFFQRLFLNILEWSCPLFLVLYSSGITTEDIQDKTELWNIILAKHKLKCILCLLSSNSYDSLGNRWIS